MPRPWILVALPSPITHNQDGSRLPRREVFAPSGVVLASRSGFPSCVSETAELVYGVLMKCYFRPVGKTATSRRQKATRSPEIAIVLGKLPVNFPPYEGELQRQREIVTRRKPVNIQPRGCHSLSRSELWREGEGLQHLRPLSKQVGSITSAFAGPSQGHCFTGEILTRVSTSANPIIWAPSTPASALSTVYLEGS